MDFSVDMQPTQPPPAPLLEQSFKNPSWPPNHINAENVLEYFCDPGNIFYDRQSDNEQIRMQNLAASQPLHELLL